MFQSKRHARAYLMGVYLSDGHVSEVRGRFTLAVSDVEFRDEAATAMEVVGAPFSLGGFQPLEKPDRYTGKVYPRKRTYTLRERALGYGKGFKVGYWLEGEFWGVKDHLPNIRDELARDLVAGIMDGDGGVSFYRQRYYQVAVFGKSAYLADLQTLFAKHDVLMHYRPGKNGHYINTRSFVKAGFYFRMSRKQVLVEAYAASMQISYIDKAKEAREKNTKRSG